MSLEQAKNALVASFFELSNAAKDAATATVNFYKAAGVDGTDTASSLAALSASITGATQAALADLPQEIKANGSVEKPVEKKLRKRPAPKDDPPVEKQPESSGESQLSTETAPTPVLAVEKAEKPEKAEKAEKPKKRKIERDPNAPKKPLTTYLRFNLSIRDLMKRERIENGLPTYPATELNQIIAERWANLTPPEKEALQKAYESEFEDYKKALEAYNATKTAEGGTPIPIPGAPRKTGAKPGPKPGSKKKESEKKEEKKDGEASVEQPAEKAEEPSAKASEKKEVNPVEKKEPKTTEKKTPATPKEKKKKAKPAPAENSTVANAIAAAAAEVAEEAAKAESDKSSNPSSQNQQKKKKKKDKDASGEKKKKKTEAVLSQ